MTKSYEQALEDAQKELAATDATAEALERKRAKLRQAIAVLNSLLGSETEPDESLTLAILDMVKAQKGFVTASEVMDRLVMRGFQVQTATVATILSRMAKAGQIEKDSEGGSGYRWVARTEAQKARDKFIEMANRRRLRKL